MQALMDAAKAHGMGTTAHLQQGGVAQVNAVTAARMGLQTIASGGGISAVAVDANYIRASDAELFWKG